MDEREFELINIIGMKLASNQRDLSRHMNLSLGMINMLIRRMITKGFIRIQQLNKRRVEYILTPKGFSEKMRQSMKYTLNTISRIGLINTRLKEVLSEPIKQGERDFVIVGGSDLDLLVKTILQEVCPQKLNVSIVKQPPTEQINGTVLICKENCEADYNRNRIINILEEVAKEPMVNGYINEDPEAEMAAVETGEERS